jgi:hypothetical protein
MAESKSTENQKRVIMTTDEVHSLADRLFSRGITKLTSETAEQQRDLRTASRAIRTLLRHFSSSDTIVIENGNGA